MPHGATPPTPPSSWATQQLAEFLVAVAACEDVSAAITTAIQKAAESLEAEVAAMIREARVLSSIGFPRGRVPVAALVACADHASPQVELPDGQILHALAVPMDGDTLLVARSDAAFQPDEIGLLRAMARTVAMTLRSIRALDHERALREEGERRATDNARLLAMLQERQALLERLTRIQGSISRRRPLPEVLDAIAEGAQELLREDVVVVRLRDRQSPELTNVVASKGLSRAILSVVQRGRLDEGLGGQAILQDRLVMTDDYQHHAHAQPVLRAAMLQSSMGAPVHEKGEVVGSIVVASYRAGRSYTEAEQEVLLAFAHHASIALNDAKAVDEMRYLAYHDSLTGLPNRALFFEHLDHALANATRTKTTVALLYLDVDRFKNVNDSLGHPVGDVVLATIAARLRSTLRAADLAARLGGDEFAVLSENTTAEGASTLADTIARMLSEPMDVQGHELTLATSIGVALDEGGRMSPDTLLRNADLAMYRAKTDGITHHLMYEPGMHVVVSDRVHLEGKLRRAVEQDEFVVHYQPIVELETGSPVGVEALVRWRRPDGTLVPPADFLPVAEEIGVIVPIGRTVMSEAMRQVGSMRCPDGHPLRLHVNLSARHLHQPDAVADIVDALRATGFSARDLTIEITETALMHDTSLVGARLEELHRLGVRIALDDFGTGYSSLAYLRNFPIDSVKIDKSFVGDIGRGEGGNVARAVIELGRTLDLDAVAEGVETPEQVAELLRLGCRLAQGYHFAPPLPARELASFLRRERRVSRGKHIEALAG